MFIRIKKIIKSTLPRALFYSIIELKKIGFVGKIKIIKIIFQILEYH